MMASLRESAPLSATAGIGAPDRSGWLRWLLLFAIAVRVATLGMYPLMDNTEARYAEIARKMIETGNWVTPQFQYGVAFWSKPPLSTWITAGTYAVLGVNEFAARFSSFVSCLVVLWLTMDLAGRRRVGGLRMRSAVVLFTTPLFFISAGAVMTDPALAVGTTLSMAGFWQAMTREGRAARVWGYLFFVGLAIGLLAKGPVGAVLTFLPVGLWTLWKGGVGNVWRRLPWIGGTLLTIALALPWYLLAESRTPGFLDYFIIGEHWKRYTVTGWKGDMFGTAHARPRGMIWPLSILATLPWCVVWLGMLWQARRRDAPAAAVADDGWRAYLLLWLFASPVFFTFAGNILFTYVLPALPAFALLVGEAWTGVGDGRGRGASTAIAALAIPVLMILGIAFVVPRVGPEHSQKALVVQYQALRTTDAERLIYVNEAPQSAEFYAGGHVVTVKTLPELDRFLDDGQRDFYALTQGQFDLRPDLASRLTPVGRYGRYLLLQDAAPPALPARPTG